MHSGDAAAACRTVARMSEVIYEMSRKGLGMTTVVEDGKLVGLISDGDLRRLLERHGKERSTSPPAECMTRNPQTDRPR